MNSWTIILIGLFIYWMGLKVIASFVVRLGRERNVSVTRTQYVSRTIATVWSITLLLIVSLISGVEYEEVGIFVSSMVALLGVALFAQWSILSNMTASIMIFFFFPFRVGNWVKIYDKEDSVEGEVVEITLFHVILRDEEGTVLTYPNSMVFQKAVSIKRSRNVSKRAGEMDKTTKKTEPKPKLANPVKQETGTNKEKVKVKAET